MKATRTNWMTSDEARVARRAVLAARDKRTREYIDSLPQRIAARAQRARKRREARSAS